MATKLTQTIVNGATSEQEAGSQLYDSEVRRFHGILTS